MARLGDRPRSETVLADQNPQAIAQNVFQTEPQKTKNFFPFAREKGPSVLLQRSNNSIWQEFHGVPNFSPSHTEKKEKGRRKEKYPNMRKADWAG